MDKGETAALLLSDRLPIETIVSIDLSRKLFYKDRFDTAPIALENGTFYWRHGAYKFFQVTENIKLCLFAANPDDMDCVDVTVTEEIRQRYKETNGQDLPYKVGEILPDRLKKPKGEILILPQWLVDDGEKDAMAIMRDHQQAWADWIARYDMIRQLSPDVMANKGMVYEFIPHASKQTQAMAATFHTMAWAGTAAMMAYTPPPVPSVDESSNNIGDLVVTMIPNNLSSVDHSYDDAFKGPLNNVLRIASLRCPDVSREQAMDMALADFPSRAEMCLWQKNPHEKPLVGVYGKSKLKNKFLRSTLASFYKFHRFYKLHRLGPKHPKPVSLAFWDAAKWTVRKKPWEMVPRFIAREFYGVRQMRPEDWKATLATTASANIPLIIWDILTGTLNPAILFARVAGQTTGNAGVRMRRHSAEQKAILKDESVWKLLKFLGHSPNKNQDKGSRVNCERLLYLGGMKFADLDIKESMKVHGVLPGRLKAALKYLMDSRFGRRGMYMRPFHLGENDAMRTEEPNGLGIEHVISENLCIARLDLSKADNPDYPLPSYVTDLFKAIMPERPYIMVRYDRELKELKANYLTVDEYREIWQGLSHINPKTGPRIHNKLVPLPPGILDPKQEDDLDNIINSVGEGVWGQLDDFVTRPLGP